MPRGPWNLQEKTRAPEAGMVTSTSIVFLGQDVAIELARDGDVVQRAGLVLDAEAQTLPRLAAQESGAEIVVVCFHLHYTKRANVTRAVIGKGDAADGERLRLGARGRG